MDDQKLINLLARCAIKDQQALQELYEETASYLNYVAFRILQCEDLSNDALQEAFIQIWQNAVSYRPHLAKPMTWMSSIVRYRAIDKRKLMQRNNALFVEGDTQAYMDISDETDKPEDALYQCDLKQHIQKCLERLSDDIRESIVRAYCYGDSREEIATRLKTKPNTVKSWLHRGSARLKACLQDAEVLQ